MVANDDSFLLPGLYGDKKKSTLACWLADWLAGLRPSMIHMVRYLSLSESKFNICGGKVLKIKSD